MAGRPILLEIGTEEIPARFIPRALSDIKELAEKKLTHARLGFGEIKSNATPRRLALIVEDVSEIQRDEVREAFGPPKKAAYDKDGNLTKAALGFVKAQGVEQDKIVIKDKEGKGEYVSVTVEEKGQPASDVLPGLMKDIVMSMTYPKQMRWGDGTIRYARPIHWVLALQGGDTVGFDIEGIKSGNMTRGHRFLAPDEIEISSPGEYASKLEAANVVVDVRARMQRISSQSAELAQSVKGKPVYDDELLSILACITEYPVAVLVEYDKKYLDLPDELLNSVMVGHQKYVPVADGSGRLMNHFIVVSNTKIDNADTVRRGAERVIRARFDDAVFYYSDDKQKKLADRMDDLKNVTFQDKLGNLYEKALRVRDVAAKVADLLAPGAKADAVRAAELAKSDLLSGVVNEFPELQGIMGMYYARHDREGDAVAEAIREQYLPAFSGDEVPSTEAGTVVALAERIDNIVSFFGIDLIPTGSEDPYALRRAANGIIAIWMHKEFKLGELIECGLSGSENSALVAQIQHFVIDRIGPILASQGHPVDIVNAISSGPFLYENAYNDIVSRLDALKAFKSDPAYNDFLMGIKRVRNIAPDEKLVEPNEGTEPAEKTLYKEYKSVKGQVQDMAQKGDYTGAIKAMTKLTAPINTFFDDVLVMDKDEAVKNNRLSLLKMIDITSSSTADFSKLDEH